MGQAIDRNLRLLTCSKFAAQLGTSAAFAGLVLALTDSGASPTSLGLVLTATVVVDAVATPFAGIAGDRLDRRRVMVVSDVIAAALYTALCFSHGTFSIAVLAVAATAAESFFFPASSAAVANLFRHSDLAVVSSRLSRATSLGSLLGPVTAGIVASILSPRFAFGVNAMTFLLSASVTMALRGQFQADGGDSETRQRETVATWDIVGVFRAYPAVSHFMTMWGCIQLGTGGLWVVIPTLAARLGDSDRVYTAWLTAGAVGTVLGATIVGRLAGRGRRGATLLVALGAQAAVLALMAVQMQLIWVGFLFAVFRGAQAVMGAYSYAIFQSGVPDHVRARASSWVDFVTLGAFAIGMAAAGPIVQLTGARTSLGLTTALVLVGFFAAWRLMRQRIRQHASKQAA